MMKFVVKSVTKQENITVVALEPLNQPLLLENEIPPGCIQHIILTLENNMESKEICDKMCDILCNVNMDDDNSRNYNHFILVYVLFILFPFLADNRRQFKEYYGIWVLCDLFEEYKGLPIFKALVHIIEPRESTFATNIFIHLALFLSFYRYFLF